jgi:hypothetical protein
MIVETFLPESVTLVSRLPNFSQDTGKLCIIQEKKARKTNKNDQSHLSFFSSVSQEPRRKK